MAIVVAGAVIDGDKLLIAQRSKPAELAGQWELPGGKVAEGESEPQALARELREELGIEVEVDTRMGEDVVVGNLVLRAYRARLRDGGIPHPHEHLALRWVTADELDTVEWVAADAGWIPALRAALVGPRPV
ncbi:(deoxy)nucleoside triphosphate pyrophosphohydrolase [Mycobacteroides chelonae]|jgi:8-oxo-dGTP diphosphatase|uniref:8-oxo-dGTP diphosphatase n=1 Tax=Mycobacteroides chelonae TaxID=1774 RepID=A0AB73M2S7_MYCCH|nr:(deoxy)nucleoside triphosphate pyrophosphohydrolase [Mycobacteroides chelonae]MBF9328190.1 (deoxy)nucleoside triphosphate pyrophosphohydrolase [Mycobacteroides chelonae]MBF9422368.1 (deoxy)nucleoside triphosphate pyrophosphohydrolase [Mycobacteroides chelonae]MBF9435484.1 (deoxy)nucleoside triphosphate pyrophosphohydrolase [Mycobacteroides chelonae]MBV6362242.1 (deoxy)nucleoside triphosphate pyrophosphohydrolase [Mycobacteroides chelonae]MEC4837085.1 (deoxy)nucleoside triphosphate pyrophosp